MTHAERIEPPDIVEIAGRKWTIEHIALRGELYYGCGVLPLRRDRADLVADITKAQGPEWRYR